MAITLSAPVEGAAAIAALEPGTLIAAVVSSETSRSFAPVNAPSSGTAASAWYPSILQVTGLTWQDHIDIQDVLQYGPVTMSLKAGTADTISNPGMTFVLDQNATVITASGTF